MSFIYQYSILNDVTAQSVDLLTLNNSIISTFTTNTLIGTTVDGDVLYIGLEQPLSDDDKIVLDGIVQDHDPVPPVVKSTRIALYPLVSKTSNTYYTSIGSIIYTGSSHTGMICAIDSLSKVDQGSATYTIQIINRTDNSIIAEETFDNTTLQICNFSTLNKANIPTELSVIEAMCKVNKTGKNTFNAYLNQIVFWLA